MVVEGAGEKGEKKKKKAEERAQKERGVVSWRERKLEKEKETDDPL